MDARTFLGIESTGVDGHWGLTVTPEVATPGEFLFGGCGLGASLVALEEATGRPTVWATAQYLSFAPTGSRLDFEVVVAAAGHHMTQGRVIAREGDKEILTVNAALGSVPLDASHTWVEPPRGLPPPEDCPRRELPEIFKKSILDRIDVRVAKGATFEGWERDSGVPGDRDTALWARVPGHLAPSAATLAIFGDYVPGGISQPLGRRTMGRSLDNTLRVAHLVPTEWVLCDIRIDALANGVAQGVAFLWSLDGTLMATASQSLAVRFWAD